jgi:hypothetical protein
MAKLGKLTPIEFTGDKIDNCFYVDINDNGQSKSLVSMKSIFEDIKSRALEDEGVTVQLTGERIIFIKGKKNG